MWAIAASGGLLLLMMALAEGLILTKSAPIHLGPLQPYPGAMLRVRLPEGWQPFDPGPAKAAVVVAVAESASDGVTGRSVLLFRSRPASLPIPSRQGEQALTTLAGALRGDLNQNFVLSSRGGSRLGRFPAWSLELAPDPYAPAARPTWLLGRAAVVPAGQIFGVMLCLPHPPRSVDRTALDEIGHSIELDDVRIAGEPESCMRAAGILFQPPPEARFVENADPHLRRIQLFGGDGLARWFLQAHCVPLVAPRTPADLVRDCGRSRLETWDFPHEIDASEEAKRPIATTEIPLRDQQDDLLQAFLVSCAQVDDETALFVEGWCEPDERESLRRAVAAVTRAEVVDAPQRGGLSDARNRAKQLLQGVRSTGLTSLWGKLDGSREAYTIGHLNQTWGTETREYRKRRREGTLWWEVQVELDLNEPHPVMGSRTDEIWLVRDDATACMAVMQSFLDARRVYTCRELYTGSGDAVARELELAEHGVQRASADVDPETYACEPVLIRAAALLARQEDAGPALFNTTEIFAGQSVYWLLEPLGEAPIPGATPGKPARVVRLQRDFDPAPIMLYFDDGDTLVAVVFDGGAWRKWTLHVPQRKPRNSLLERLLRGFQ